MKVFIHPLHAGVLDAYWHPLYDLYTTSNDGKPSTTVSLHYRVNLQQYTGEDWINATLILSTSATDVLNAGIPKPDDLIVRTPTPPLPLPVYRRRSRHYSPVPSELSPQFSPASLMASEVPEEDYEGGEGDFDISLSDSDAPIPLAFEAPVPLPQLVKTAAAISKSPMAISYTVDALTTIPSDGLSYKVLVATIPFEAVIKHITTPRKTPVAYLQVMSIDPLLAIELTRRRFRSALSRTQAITTYFLVPSAPSSTIRSCPKRTSLTSQPGTRSSARSEWIHPSESLTSSTNPP